MHFIDVLAVKPLTVANQVILGKFISWCQSSLHCVMLTPWPHQHLHNTAATYVNRNWSLPRVLETIFLFLRFYAANLYLYNANEDVFANEDGAMGLTILFHCHC